MFGAMTGPWSEWFGGAATLVAVTAAYLFGRSERKRSDGVIGAERLLTREALAQNDREFEYRRLADERSQAALVGCETGYSALMESVELFVSNDSSSTIWGVRWFLVIGDGITRQPEGSPIALLAGKTHRYSPAIGAVGVNRMVSAGVMSGITFVDNAGVEWIKWGDRRLERLADIGEQLNGPVAKARMRKHRNESMGLME